MGYGVAAEVTKSGAQELADKVHGRIFTFTELIDKRGEFS